MTVSIHICEREINPAGQVVLLLKPGLPEIMERKNNIRVLQPADKMPGIKCVTEKEVGCQLPVYADKC